MKKALIAFVLTSTLLSCGPYQIDVDGKITHKFEIDMSNLEKYFQVLCEQEQAEDVSTCTSLKLAQFLQFMIDSSKE